MNIFSIPSMVRYLCMYVNWIWVYPKAHIIISEATIVIEMLSTSKQSSTVLGRLIRLRRFWEKVFSCFFVNESKIAPKELKHKTWKISFFFLLAPSYGSLNQKLTKNFAVNNSSYTCSLQLKMCSVTLCYKMKTLW